MANFQIIESCKTGLLSPDSYVVTRTKTSFLRLLGKKPTFELMTATANEDTSDIRVCLDQRRLIEAALHTSKQFGMLPGVKADRFGREYVKICTISREAGESEEFVYSQLNEVIECFFDFYDNHKSLDVKCEEEMQCLYDELVVDDGEDVYLGDGVWLSSDGSFHNRGR